MLDRFFGVRGIKLGVRGKVLDYSAEKAYNKRNELFLRKRSYFFRCGKSEVNSMNLFLFRKYWSNSIF